MRASRYFSEADTRTTHTISLDYAVLHFDYTNKRLKKAWAKYGRNFCFESADAEGAMFVTAQGS